MTTYQHAAPAPAQSGGTDVAAWALVALIVATICAGAGWAIARQDVPGDVSRTAEMASREGFMRGETTGYGEGARLGRKQVALRTQAQMATERRQAATEGYDTGFMEGRAKAGDPNAYMNSTAGMGAYPAAGYEDILAADLFGGDVAGFSDSAYDSRGYGTGTTTPYLGSTSGGDDHAGLGY